MRGGEQVALAAAAAGRAGSASWFVPVLVPAALAFPQSRRLGGGWSMRAGQRAPTGIRTQTRGRRCCAGLCCVRAHLLACPPRCVSCWPSCACAAIAGRLHSAGARQELRLRAGAVCVFARAHAKDARARHRRGACGKGPDIKPGACVRQGTTYEYFATCPVGIDQPLPYVERERARLRVRL